MKKWRSIKKNRKEIWISKRQLQSMLISASFVLPGWKNWWMHEWRNVIAIDYWPALERGKSCNSGNMVGHCAKWNSPVEKDKCWTNPHRLRESQTQGSRGWNSGCQGQPLGAIGQKKSLRKRLQRLRIGQQLLFLTVGNWDTKEFTAFEMLDSWRAGVGGSND